MVSKRSMKMGRNRNMNRGRNMRRSRSRKGGAGTDEGFLKVYKRVKNPYKLQYILTKENNFIGQDYCSFRNTFIKSRLGQIKAAKTPLFYTSGKYKGQPTKQHIVLIMYAYSPVDLQ